MSLLLVNEVAYYHDAAKQAAMDEFGYGDPRRQAVWEYYEDHAPKGVDSWACDDQAAVWLFNVCPGFFFPAEGLRGEDCERLLQNLRALYCLMRKGVPTSDHARNSLAEALRDSGFDLIEGQDTDFDRVVSLGLFLKRSNVIYTA